MVEIALTSAQSMCLMMQPQPLNTAFKTTTTGSSKSSETVRNHSCAVLVVLCACIMHALPPSKHDGALLCRQCQGSDEKQLLWRGKAAEGVDLTGRTQLPFSQAERERHAPLPAEAILQTLSMPLLPILPLTFRSD